MTGAIQQGRVGASPPGASPVPGSSRARQGHYAMVARMVHDFELATERITDLDELPLDLLERFARALNRAERRSLARVNTLEQEATD